MECGKINLLIVFGGCGVESDISIQSALTTKLAVDLKKHDYTLVYYRNNHFFIVNKIDKTNPYSFIEKRLKPLKVKRKKDNLYVCGKKIDLVLPIMHGKNLENGVIESYFKTLGFRVGLTKIPFNSIFQNKYLTKLLLKDVTNVLDSYLISDEDILNDDVFFKIASEINFDDVICKANNLGSSVGIYKGKKENLRQLVTKSLRYDNEVIIEEKLKKFLEYTIAVYSYDKVILSDIEVIDDKDFYLYDKKYQKKQIKFLDDKVMIEKINTEVIKIIKKINLKGLVRIDFLFDVNAMTLYLNEINATPGALSYYLFEHKGIMFSDLIDLICQGSMYLENKEKRKVVNTNEYNLKLSQLSYKK